MIGAPHSGVGSVKSRQPPFLGPPAPVATGACAITAVRARAGWPAGSRRSQDNSQTLHSGA